MCIKEKKEFLRTMQKKLEDKYGFAPHLHQMTLLKASKEYDDSSSVYCIIKVKHCYYRLTVPWGQVDVINEKGELI